ncbi:39S ribosomal protein S18a, mitochondrial [Holothuria leucospilota]|uniref:39S ribosomal protein S18a, mitochondrial n=1 Tax=Holothuria leucospilota TaxID=206669 RepID=A0A9Q1CJ86_HOLLE|nr:39S ribosomal protein S18a, mitochondrial [Holothuria leucospilota]
MLRLGRCLFSSKLRNIVIRQNDYKVSREFSVRLFSTTSKFNSEKYREVKEYEDGNTIVVEGVKTDVGEKLHEVNNPLNACPICSRNLMVTYRDVLILEQFVAKNGEILPRRITGLCVKQHRLLRDCIDKSQKAGLLPPPDISKREPPPEDMRIPKGSFNVYFRTKKKD